MTFVHNINPILIDFGPVQIRYYGIFLVITYLIGYFGFKYLIKNKLNESQKENYILILLISIIIFQRLVHVIFYDFNFYFSNPIEIFKIWKGGIASHGTILGIIIATYYYSKKIKKKFFLFSDPIAIAGSIAGMFVRFGNFFNGEIVGRVTNLSWGVKFPCCEGFRHPVQLYEAFGHIIVFGILYFTYKKRKNNFNGFYSGLFLFTYGIMRFIIEFFKEYLILNSGLTMGQWLSIPLIALGGYLIWKKK